MHVYTYIHVYIDFYTVEIHLYIVLYPVFFHLILYYVHFPMSPLQIRAEF